MFALLTSEELEGDETDEIKGINYLEKGHKVEKTHKFMTA